MILREIGRFFVCNVLVIDRFHVKLKKMASGVKHAMQSLCNNLNTFYSAQHWAMKKSLYPHAPPQGSELAKSKEIPKYESVTEALGSHTADVLSLEELHDLYKVYICIHFVHYYTHCNFPRLTQLLTKSLETLGQNTQITLKRTMTEHKGSEIGPRKQPILQTHRRKCAKCPVESGYRSLPHASLT